MTFADFATMLAPTALIVLTSATIGTIARQARLADWARTLDLSESQKRALRDLWHAAQTTKSPSPDPLARLTEEERQVLWFFSDVVARPAEFNYPQRAEQNAEHVREKLIAKYLSLGFSQEQADLLSGMVVNKLRVAVDSNRGTSIVGLLSRIPPGVRYVLRITLAAGCAVAIFPWSWWLALTSIPALMYASNIIHDEPEPSSAARLTYDGIVYVCVAAWAIIAVIVLVTSMGQWWAVVPGAVTAFVGYHSFLPGRWVEEHQSESKAERLA
jgi:hypothetical protein